MKKTTSSENKSKAKPTPAPAKAAAPAKPAAAKPAVEKTPAAAVKAKSPTAPKAVKAPKAVAPKEPVAATPVASCTTLVAVVDIGFGNQLFVRGEGAGLSWDRGLQLQNVAADKWQVSLDTNGSPLTFKFLVNDLTWNLGEDYVAQPGGTVTLQPVFS